MADKCRQALNMAKLYARMDLEWFTQDTLYCGLVILGDALSTLAALAGIFLLSEKFGGIGGLTDGEILWMLGFFTMGDGLGYMLFGNFNVSLISRRVGRGQVDHMLMQPVPLWMPLLTEGFMPVSGNSTFLCGLFVTCAAAARLGIPVTPPWLLGVLFFLLLRVALTLGVDYLAGSLAFYQPAAMEEISSVVSDSLKMLGRYPLSGMPAWLTALLTTALPSGLTAWLPAMILLGKTNCAAWLLPVVVTGAFTALATHCFRRGLRHYMTTGSVRYKEMGHRS